MNEPLFEVKDLKIQFRAGKALVRAVDGVSLALHRGETLSLVGESGCGKTTCARALLGVYPPAEGEVLWNGRPVSSLRRGERADFRRKNQMIFQDPYESLDPRMTVGEIIEEGARRHFDRPAAEHHARTRELLATVGLSGEFASRFPHELSGGQRQRVGIARALALEPECLICDEPIAALDVSIQAQIVNLLIRLQKERGLTYLLISHDLAVVRHVSDRIAVMYLGRVVELADAEALYASPRHPYTRALLSAIPQADPDRDWLTNRTPLTGELPSPTAALPGCGFASRCPYADGRCRAEAPPLREAEKGHFVSCWKN